MVVAVKCLCFGCLFFMVMNCAELDLITCSCGSLVRYFSGVQNPFAPV
jgi:hypothetical protein